ncbi:MAG: short-chain dehydrogenase [Bacteroides sp. SM23_62_1]|nr:MAG: short-chain dehydrogenase [Bacteroides sp. SM23_62_1]
MKFKNKVVWITGASSGIGEALAYEFTHEGAKTILSSNEPEELEGVKKRCEEMGGESCVLFLDLLDTPSLGEATKKAIEKYGCIDILINNGGISHRSMVHETDIDFDRRIMEIDFFSYIILTKSLLPHMLERGGGQIAVTSSLSGIFGFPLRSAYAAAKHAVKGYFETVSIELRDRNIFVTIAYPGRIRTNISLRALTKDGKPQGVMDKGLAGGLPVEKCAKIYVNAIYKKRREVLIGGRELLMAYIRRFCPRLFWRLVGRVSPV